MTTVADNRVSSSARRLVILFIIAAAGSQVVSAGDSPDHPASSLQPVFHHICEVPHLGELLRNHRVQVVKEGKQAGRTLCSVADFPFRKGAVYFELFPAPEVDELWLVDSAAPVGRDLKAELLTRLTRTDDALVVEAPSVEALRFPRERGREDRLWLRFEAGEMTLLLDHRDGRPLLSKPLPFHDGIQLLIPSEGASCGPEECGLMALDVYLAPEEARRWAKSTVLSGKAR